MKCGTVLSEDGGRLVCGGCEAAYRLCKEAAIFTSPGNPFFLDKEDAGNIVNKLKDFFKRYPILYKIFYFCFGSYFIGRPVKSLLNDIPEGNLILNLGSGFKIIRKDVINVDSFLFKGVDVAADIKKLPFADNSARLIICDAVLEHMSEPELAVKEMFRVLAPGGAVYATVPFIFGFHSSPEDYYRWTESGFRELMKDFSESEIGVCAGPASAAILILSEWLAIILSFGIKKLYELLTMLFLVIFSPLKLLDLLCRNYPPSKNIAAGFYFIGYKR